MKHREDQMAAGDDAAPALQDENRALPSTQRRSIFDTFWSRSASSSSWKEERIEEDSEEDDRSTDARHEVKSSPKLEPSYLGVYNFSPTTPVVSRTPSSLSPVGSSKSLTQLPGLRPKSILHRHQSSGGRSKSTFVTMQPPPFLEDTSQESRSSAESEPRGSSRASVHFDPTITVREVIQDDTSANESNWFDETELRSFMMEAVNLCHSSAMHWLRTYSLPALTNAIAAAHKAGVDDPVMGQPSNREYRSLFSDPILYASDDDVVVHDCSNDFFMVISNEVKSILIVDNSATVLNLFKRYVLSMFPAAEVEQAQSGEEALELLGKANSGSSKAPNYDIIIVEENLQAIPSSVPIKHSCSDDQDDTSSPLSGSDLLKVINFVERNSPDTRNSLKIGVSVDLAGDCEALRRSGADLFW
eukprot:CAMPEP_0201689448 /NCGR_PEP_ID=MMETSP0578-20130828/3029_1 /ASSEMBLY_ACC=CAM_ASM_000663 /TAXON_ID=267565 /ORGANISM="Skeletonema grethea, Strain CCMP 1804" /LENGTH=415 /DNA_ID=CAMNT_0048174083 /DNA_START=44 /DNA_END=1288 /DNA_ORIENTATION=+